MAAAIPATNWQDVNALEEQLRTEKKSSDIATIRKYLKGVSC